MRRRLRLAPPETKLLAYNTFIRSILEYGNVVWFPSEKVHINKLEAIQRKAVRFIFNKYKTTDSPSELLKNAGLLTLQNRAKLARLKFMFQLIHNQIKINTTNLISVVQTRPTRNKHSYTLTEFACHTDCLKNSFFPLAIREWNKLSPSITNVTSLNTFLELVEKHIHPI